MKKTCSRCGVLKLIEDFDNGKAQCKKCREFKQQYRENHREEQILILNKHKETVECPICKIEVGRNKMKRHERSKRHQNNTTNTKETKQEPKPKA